MASIISVPPETAEEQRAWNEAYERLTGYLAGYSLRGNAHVARLALGFLDEAREIYRSDKSRPPSAVTMEVAWKHLAEWLATNLDKHDKPRAEILSDGAIALLLSRVFRTAPDSLLSGPLPEELRQALRETLIVAGPDLNISRMTPRHLDYGPMLGLARNTWQRWDVKAIVVALLFWSAVYIFFFWLLSAY